MEPNHSHSTGKNCVPKDDIFVFFKSLQAWGLQHYPGQPVLMLNTSFGKEILPNIQPKPPLVPLEVVFSCPVFCCSGDGSSHQIFVRHEGFGNNKKNPKHIYVCVIKETGSQALLLIT